MDRKEHTWERFITAQQLNQYQQDQFKAYLELLQQRNKEINLTRLSSFEEIVKYHFQDSLALAQHKNMHTLTSIADVGAGAGFPGIPLKIMYPHLKLILIEVVGKKIGFLNEVIQLLTLDDTQVITLDWRTFLRKTDYSIDLFCARASLAVEELLRMFKPSSPYNGSTLVYWAAYDWQPNKREKPFVTNESEYTLNHKKRKLIFLHAQK